MLTVRRIVHVVAVCLLVLATLRGTSAAQDVVNPRNLEFTASADHDVITRYEVRFYQQGATAPVQVNPFAKGALPADRVIRVAGMTWALTLPVSTTPYVVRVAAICDANNPVCEGEGLSDPSNPFTRTKSPPASPTVVKLSR